MSPIKETDGYMIYVSQHGKYIEFPKRARYKRNPNRSYYSGDFADGEVVLFSNFSGDDDKTSMGYAWYFGTECKRGNFIDLDEVEEITDGE